MLVYQSYHMYLLICYISLLQYYIDYNHIIDNIIIFQYILQIYFNACSLITQLPCRSHHRAPIVQYLCNNIPSLIASLLLPVSDAYIRKARTNKHKNIDILAHTYLPPTKRQRIHNNEKNIIISLLHDTCPTKSGSPRPVLYQFITNKQLHEQYEQYIQHYNITHPNNTITIHNDDNVLNQIKKQLHVRRVNSYHGQYDCNICIIKPTNKYDIHVKTYNHQWEQFHITQQKLQQNQLLLIFDFTAIQLLPNTGMYHTTFIETVKYNYPCSYYIRYITSYNIYTHDVYYIYI
jgi:hypothetical protein